MTTRGIAVGVAFFPVPRNDTQQRFSFTAVRVASAFLFGVVPASHRLLLLLASLLRLRYQGIDTGAGMVVFESPVTVATVTQVRAGPFVKAIARMYVCLCYLLKVAVTRLILLLLLSLMVRHCLNKCTYQHNPNAPQSLF